MSDLLSIISASDKRRNLLILLDSGPKEWDEIKRILKVTSTGMLPQVKILEEEHLIEREGKKFFLTPMGRVLTAHMVPLIRTMDIFDKNKKYWNEHNLEVLPYEILLDIRDLGNYRIIANSDEEIFDINTFLNNIAQSKTLKGLSHTIHPRYPTFFLDLANKGMETSLILTPGVFRIIKEKYPKELDAGLNLKNAHVYVSKKDIKFSFTVTDSYFSISLFYNNGIFDSKNDVVSHDPSALRWGERIFLYFLKESEKVETID
ncbi:MAG: winged helix-turn-helix domain-containing protein [Methanoregula sp.]|jgi:predicted transcriptional regulator|uniref:helix-turn-helix transcriptional regulator n=1 Tax=Methanoregula sp. TaxID=2052170 RepID=UPI003C16C12E